MVVRVAARFFQGWRDGIAGSLPQFVGLVVLLAAAVNDLLATVRVIHTPYLMELAFLAVVIEVGLSLTMQFVAAAREQQRSAAQLEQRVVERTEQLADTRDALVQSEKLAAIGRLAAGVAHEINNPAAVVAANVEYLRSHFRTEKTLPSDGEEALAECDDSIRRIAAIVRELLDAGRIAGKPSKPEPVDLLQVVEDASLLARKAPGATQTQIELRIPSGLGALSGHGALEQALVNLLVNAIQAIGARPGGRVVIAAERIDSKVQLVVSDNGPGIPAAVQRQIFEPFFTTKGPGKGTGLGLSTVYGIVKQSGAHITVRSSPGAGSAFEIFFPRQSGAVAAPARAASVAEGGHETILLVEDEPGVRAAVAEGLRAGGYRVLPASCADEAEALAVAERDVVHLLLTDVALPGRRGPDLARLIRARWPGVGVLYMSGHPQDAFGRQGALEEGVDFIAKPFTAESLRARVRAALDRVAWPPRAARG
jgi:signal transduction histidine kinase/ActR/RegA family two-component response regulator